MDELKKYLQQQRQQLDTDEPGELVWKKVQQQTQPSKSRGKLVKMMVRFAAAAVIISVVFIAVKLNNDNDSSPSFATIKSLKVFTPETSTVIARLTQEDNTTDTVKEKKANTIPHTRPDKRYMLMNSFKENYSQLVNYQLNSIRSTPVYAENPAYFSDFKNRIHQMDLDEMTIRNNIRQNGMSNALLEQLINVYQQKLDVLKSLQQEINKMNTRVQQNNPADSLNKFYLNI